MNTNIVIPIAQWKFEYEGEGHAARSNEWQTPYVLCDSHVRPGQQIDSLLDQHVRVFIANLQWQ